MQKLILFDMSEDMCKAWGDAFKTSPEVEVFHGTLDDLVARGDVDIISSAGNSFGIMGAGIDGALAAKFPGIKDRVRQTVQSRQWCGLIPVGMSFLEPLRDAPIDGPSYLAYTPTMPRPGTRDLDPFNVYLAMTGLLRVGESFLAPNNLTLACPGMGTGIGGVKPRVAAAKQAWAYEHHRRFVDNLNNPG